MPESSHTVTIPASVNEGSSLTAMTLIETVAGMVLHNADVSQML